MTSEAITTNVEVGTGRVDDVFLWDEVRDGYLSSSCGEVSVILYLCSSCKHINRKYHAHV